MYDMKKEWKEDNRNGRKDSSLIKRETEADRRGNERKEERTNKQKKQRTKERTK